MVLKSLQPETMKELQNISMAVNLCKLITSISSFLKHDKGDDGGDSNSGSSFKLEKRELLLKLLRWKWKDAKGSVFNENYSYLIRHYVKVCDEPLTYMEEICNGPIQCIVQNGSNGDYPALNKMTVICFYRGFSEELNNIVKTKLSVSTRQIVNDEETTDDYLSQTHSALKVFQILNSFVKDFENRNFMMATIKYAKVFLEVFLKNVMPILDRTLRSHKQMVHGILKIAQQSTRSLQHLCSHTKVNKDVTMTTHVPALKKCLEAFVFRVKAVLAYNNCDSVFWIGNLKNRDLQGNEIQSQADTTVAEGEDEDETEEQEGEETMDDDGEEEEDECSESF